MAEWSITDRLRNHNNRRRNCDCVRCEAADEIERLQVIVAAVNDLHSPRLNHDTCVECDHDWPCPTHRALHPKEARRG